MKCEEVKPLIEEFYDNNLKPDLKLKIEQHISDCQLCKIDFARLQKLSFVLQKSPLPPPSTALDKRIFQEFSLEHESRRAPKAGWWQKLFTGSIAIPKPVFAATVIVIALGLILSNWLGRGASNSAEIADAKISLPLSDTAQPYKTGEANSTKIIEVPVVRERLVKQIVYVERSNRNTAVGNSQRSFLAYNKLDIDPKEKIQRVSPVIERDVTNLKMNQTISESERLISSDLRGFQTVEDMKARILKEDKVDEK